MPGRRSSSRSPTSSSSPRCRASGRSTAPIIQHADLGIFERLGPGDVCFYDGSHCVRTGGDVNWFLFEVLPRLAPGVYVQIHDIFLPDDYHDGWVFDEGLSWNEQYLVQAFLMHNDA